ncbi:transcriptional regulator [Desulfitobacterium dichloroeliminans LMG P-21439]|uniref:Transcriptional regulator n=1 Tax=Desulfitobacterium dichloroeliminans (strain LMG P-21439 / DCA1) TaxID=871963 RepID=L0FBE4_DESDL|nr:FadR/GntR family transcriptional regulator [Desulfitobacterium dichloroeliminans]AGA70517.1 transcriptional regulator [Desulfitobacterium dichloroeliminans LMG P-21439]
MFEPVKTHGNLSEEIVKQVVQSISNGELKPGDKLPSEREMCNVFSVSRTVVRDALKTLSGLGMVTIRHGLGAYVNEVDEDASRLASLLQISLGTFEEIFQVREILEGYAALWCTQNATDKDIEELGKIVKRGKELGPASDGKLTLLDAEFHLKVAEASGNKVLKRLMINILDLTGEIRDSSFKIPGRQYLSVLEHEAIYESIKQRDPDLAFQNMIKHIETVEKDIHSSAHGEGAGSEGGCENESGVCLSGD